MEQTVETLAVRVDKLEKDTAELFFKVNSAAVSQATISEKLNSLLITLGEVKEAVASLVKTPSRRLDMIYRAVITAVISGVCGFILAKMQ